MERINTEKRACAKLKDSMSVIGTNFVDQLQNELEIIKNKDAVSEKLAKDMIDQKKNEGEAEATDKKEDETPVVLVEDKRSVNSYKISAVTTMLDDFENILAKNFCQFANKQDLSFM
jgi:hypothetical protein